jgi:hypothetical protein
MLVAYRLDGWPLQRARSHGPVAAMYPAIAPGYSLASGTETRSPSLARCLTKW